MDSVGDPNIVVRLKPGLTRKLLSTQEQKIFMTGFLFFFFSGFENSTGALPPRREELGRYLQP